MLTQQCSRFYLYETKLSSFKNLQSGSQFFQHVFDVASPNCHFQTNFLSIVVTVQRC